MALPKRLKIAKNPHIFDIKRKQSNFFISKSLVRILFIKLQGNESRWLFRNWSSSFKFGPLKRQNFDINESTYDNEETILLRGHAHSRLEHTQLLCFSIRAGLRHVMGGIFKWSRVTGAQRMVPTLKRSGPSKCTIYLGTPNHLQLGTSYFTVENDVQTTKRRHCTVRMRLSRGPESRSSCSQGRDNVGCYYAVMDKDGVYWDYL